MKKMLKVVLLVIVALVIGVCVTTFRGWYVTEYQELKQLQELHAKAADGDEDAQKELKERFPEKKEKDDQWFEKAWDITTVAMFGIGDYASVGLDSFIESAYGTFDATFGPKGVDAMSAETKRLALVQAAKIKHSDLWSSVTTWPKTRLNTERSPILRPAGHDKYGRMVIACLWINDNSEEWHHIKQPIPKEMADQGWQIAYWPTNRETRVNYETALRSTLLSTELVPTVQRTSDGRTHLSEFSFREDTEGPIEYIKHNLAQWGRGALRTPRTLNGLIEIDRYEVTLARGQTVEGGKTFPYSPPLEYKGKRVTRGAWRLTARDVTLLVKLNGHLFTFGDGVDVSTQEVERGDGVIDLEAVTLSSTSAVEEANVEFVYYGGVEESNA